MKPLAAFQGSRLPGSGVPSASRMLRREGPLIGIAILALTLRCHQLLDQVPMDDEWHALMQATTHRTGEILTHFGANDVTIPIAAYYRLLLKTVGLTTVGLRLPFLMFGMATVVGFPLMVRPLVGRPAANVLAALLAVSPILVFYSRYARPYSIALFCALGAVMAFRAWWRGGRRSFAAAYVVLAACACWLLVIVGPFVLGSFLVYGIESLRVPEKRYAALKRLALLGAATLAVLAVLLCPPLAVDASTLLLHTHGADIRLEHLRGATIFALGNGVPWLALGLAGTALLGAVVLVRREPQFVGHFAVLGALQVAGFVISRPFLGEHLDVCSRYLLPVLAVILLFSAVGVLRVSDALGRWIHPWVRPVPTLAVCACMIGWSPIPRILARPNNWASFYLGGTNEWYDGFYARNIRPVSKFYETLASKPPGTVPIVEASSNQFTRLNPLPYYQRIHGQPVLIGMSNGPFGPLTWGQIPYGRPGVRLRTNVFLDDIRTMLDRGARYVVFHRDLYGETKETPSYRVTVDLRPCMDWYWRQTGPPVFEDRNIVVFELPPPSRSESRRE